MIKDDEKEREGEEKESDKENEDLTDDTGTTLHAPFHS